MKFISRSLYLSASLLPITVFAAEDAISLATRLLGSFGKLVGTAIPIVFALAILVFFWGITKYVFSKSGEGKVEGKGVMLYALIAVFIMVSLYGIITLAQRTLGVTGTGTIGVPAVNTKVLQP